jgi:hypothetical protein
VRGDGAVHHAVLRGVVRPDRAAAQRLLQRQARLAGLLLPPRPGGGGVTRPPTTLMLIPLQCCRISRSCENYTSCGEELIVHLLCLKLPQR